MNGTTSASAALSLRSLINTHKLTKAARAVLGAEIIAGEHDLRPTTKLVANAVGCSVGYLQAAKKLTPAERQAVRRGERPLILPHTPATPVKPLVMPPVAPATPPVLPVTADARHQLDRLVKEIGFDAVLNLLAMTEIERVAA
jgi:hypothetical protein